MARKKKSRKKPVGSGRKTKSRRASNKKGRRSPKTKKGQEGCDRKGGCVPLPLLEKRLMELSSLVRSRQKRAGRKHVAKLSAE